VPATREQIIETFARHAERFGYTKASVEDVAAELGISKRTIYQHFSSKRDLYSAVVMDAAAAESRRLRKVIEDLPTYQARMERFLSLVVTGMREHIHETSKADWMQEFEVAYDAMSRAYGDIATELAAGGAADGEFSFSDARLANELIGAMVTHYGTLVRDDPDLNADHEIVAAIMRMLGAKLDDERSE
jgi:AcrR family transcriptional regulator